MMIKSETGVIYRKEYNMANPVVTAIADRRSIRKYKAQQLSGDQLDALLKAAVEAPSAGNRQPWHFSIVQNQDIIKDINAEAGKAAGKDLGDIFFAAPTVIFISCDAASRWGRLDCGIAVENIALAAQSLGLGTVILGRPDAAFTGPEGPRFSKLLKFPEGHSYAVAIAVGIPDTTKEAHPLEPGRIDYIN
jgi:nitroreductase